MHRFFCADPETGLLSPEESHHALHVLRLQTGDSAVIFNGRGLECKVRLTHCERGAARFEILTRQTTPPPRYRLCLGQAIPKNKVMDLILQKATELNVSLIAPIASERSVVVLSDEKKENRTEKWRQVVLEACKQCGQNYLPQINEPAHMDEFLAQHQHFKGLRLIASLQPDSRKLSAVLSEFKQTAPPSAPEVLYLIGPEGDFSPAEMGKARSAGFIPVSLGPNILRTETASLFLSSVLSYELLG